MAKVYVMNHDGSTVPMNGICCVNEELELQKILEINPDLVPGDQINPSDPRRWLIVKREMPVPDPGTGGDRWSIDLFVVDQDATPTFIECKRYKDTRAKREVVGQMLEYAANGHHYWSKEQMRNYAEQAVAKNGLSLEEALRNLQKTEEPESIDDFFQHVQDNLRTGQVRLVFFMEKAPAELKSIVEFLNKQMERSEVLLVEARQYEHDGIKIVTPILFGYTEEARQVKKTISVTTGQRGHWDKQSFFNDTRKRLTEKQLNAIQLLYNKSQELNFKISWGTGRACGSFSTIWPQIGSCSFFSVSSDGRLWINLGNFNNNPEQREFADFFKEKLETKIGLTFPKDYQGRYPGYQIEKWAEKIDELLRVLELIQEKYPAKSIPLDKITV